MEYSGVTDFKNVCCMCLSVSFVGLWLYFHMHVHVPVSILDLIATVLYICVQIYKC